MCGLPTEQRHGNEASKAARVLVPPGDLAEIRRDAARARPPAQEIAQSPGADALMAELADTRRELRELQAQLVDARERSARDEAAAAVQAAEVERLRADLAHERAERRAEADRAAAERAQLLEAPARQWWHNLPLPWWRP
jgi:predicted  nucleic acid-binding Zn-ribbon protein